MTDFCGACGARLNSGQAFCANCGARIGQTSEPSQQATGIPAQPPPFTPVSAGQAQPSPKSSPILKLLLVVVVLLALGGALLLGGVFYAAHRASQKIHELARESSSSELFSGGPLENPCRFLSKEEVSRATGVTIVRVHPHSAGCAYIAQGDPEEMTSRHLAMTKGMEGLAAGHSASSGAAQDVEVLSFAVLSGTFQKVLVGKVFDNIGSTSQSVSGVGDRAVVVGGGIMLVRKGDKTIQIVYTRCPCNTDAVKPLAQKLVSAM